MKLKTTVTVKTLYKHFNILQYSHVRVILKICVNITVLGDFLFFQEKVSLLGVILTATPPIFGPGEGELFHSEDAFFIALNIRIYV